MNVRSSIDLQNEINVIVSELKYISDIEGDKFHKLVELNNSLFDNTKNVSYLIEICRLEKKMYATQTAISRNAAKKAFLAKPIEKPCFFIFLHLLQT